MNRSRRRRSRPKARERRRKKQTLIGAGILFVLIIVAVGWVHLRVSAERDKIPVHADTMCPKSGPNGYTVILIDGTDSFNSIQFADLKQYFQRLKNSIPKYAQIAVYAPREMTSEHLLKPLLKICNPGDAEGVSGLNANPKQIQRNYNKRFAEKIDLALSQGLDAQGAEISPIMEMIQAVSIGGFPIKADVPKHLIIVSDMLQNNSFYSHYTDEISFEVVRNKPAFQHRVTDLSGVDVDILYIARDSYEYLQTNRHGLFWEAYIIYMKGNFRSITPIRG